MRVEGSGVQNMLVFSVICGLILICGVAVAGAVTSGTGTSTVTAYQVASGSNYYQGCVSPCMCPVQIVGKVGGTFDLEPLAPSPLFNRYSVNNVTWTVTGRNGKVVHHITGSGFYEIGGEVANSQQMVLNLSIDGALPVTFDSGLVPAKVQFPDISVEVFSGGGCYKVWVNVNAMPK